MIYKVNYTKDEKGKHIYPIDTRRLKTIAISKDYILVESEKIIKANLVNDLEKEILIARILNSNNIDNLKKLKKDLLSLVRYRKEIQGIKFNDVEISTSRESQTMINNTYSSLKNNLVESINFKYNNQWELMTLETFEPIAKEVSLYVQKCFNIENEISILLDTLEMEGLQNFNVESEFNNLFEKE